MPRNGPWRQCTGSAKFPGGRTVARAASIEQIRVADMSTVVDGADSAQPVKNATVLVRGSAASTMSSNNREAAACVIGVVATLWTTIGLWRACIAIWLRRTAYAAAILSASVSSRVINLSLNTRCSIGALPR